MIVKLQFDIPRQVFPLISRLIAATPLRASLAMLTTMLAFCSPLQAQEIELRPSVMGTLRDQRQLPVADADVFVRSSAGSSSVFAKTDQEGRYQVFDLPPGNVVVVARDPATKALAMAQSQLQRPEQQMRVDVQVARADARLEGTIINGGKPVVDAHISLLSRQVFADVGVAQRTTTTDANGHFKLDRVMPGAMRIIVEADGLVSQQDVEMQGGSTQQVQIAMGNSVYLPNVLHGEDGTSAEVDWTMAMYNGNGVTQPLYQNAYTLQINGWNLPGIPAATKLLGGRELRLEPVNIEGIDVSRQVFMPANGGFIRYFDLLKNTTQADVSVQVDIGGLLGSGDRTQVVVAPEQSNQRYAITGDSGNSMRLGHVFSGHNPQVAGNFQFDSSGNQRYKWQINVPAGSSVALLHFAVQHKDVEVATALSQALAALRQPEMLLGLSGQEKAAIKNFTIQP